MFDILQEHCGFSPLVSLVFLGLRNLSFTEGDMQKEQIYEAIVWDISLLILGMR